MLKTDPSLLAILYAHHPPFGPFIYLLIIEHLLWSLIRFRWWEFTTAENMTDKNLCLWILYSSKVVTWINTCSRKNSLVIFIIVFTFLRHRLRTVPVLFMVLKQKQQNINYTRLFLRQAAWPKPEIRYRYYNSLGLISSI